MNEFTINIEKHIQYIIDDFDFEKVNKIMVALNWTWFYNLTFNVPTVDQLKETAKILLYRVYFEDFDLTSSGGFCARKYDDHLKLEFIVEEQSSSIMNFDEPNYELLKKLKERKIKLNKIKENESN
jgi:hypothetical protein